MSMFSVQMQDFPDSIMAQPSTYIVEKNPDDLNVGNPSYTPRRPNTSHTIIRERRDLVKHPTPSTSLRPTSQRRLSVSQRQSSRGKANLDPDKLTAVPPAIQNQACSMFRAYQSPTREELQPGPRGGLKGRKVHVCGFPGCGKTYTRKEHRLRHEESHTDSNKNFCETCNQKLSRPDTFGKHLISKKHLSNLQFQTSPSYEAPPSIVAFQSTLPTISSSSFMPNPTLFPVQSVTSNLRRLSPTNGQQQAYTPSAMLNTSDRHTTVPYHHHSSSPVLALHSSSATFPLSRTETRGYPFSASQGQVDTSAYVSLLEPLSAPRSTSKTKAKHSRSRHYSK